MAPWCCGTALLVSFTAAAGHDGAIGASMSLLSVRAAQAPADLMAAAAGEALAARQYRGFALGAIQFAALEIGEADELSKVPDEFEPRRDLKRNASAFPAPDRTRKGDPSIGLRPTFDAKLRAGGSLAAARLDDLLFGAREYTAFSGFTPSAIAPRAEFETELSQGIFASGATAPAAGATSPAQGGAAPTLVVSAPLTTGRDDGSTPAIPRAEALASTTPAQLDLVPVEVVAIPSAVTAANGADGATSVPRADRPDYASLIDQDRVDGELRCLAEAIYFEARSEPEAGQAAVVQVVLNRVQSGLYPPTVCDVVYQNRNRYLACQFSFACEGKSLKITEPEPWRAAMRVAGDVLSGATYLSEVGPSTHYHANYVRPRWARTLRKTDTIGSHVFYMLRPGQT